MASQATHFSVSAIPPMQEPPVQQPPSAMSQPHYQSIQFRADDGKRCFEGKRVLKM